MVCTVKFAAVTLGRVTPGESAPNAEIFPKLTLAAEVPLLPRATPPGSELNTRVMPFLLVMVALMTPVAVCPKSAALASIRAPIARIRIALCLFIAASTKVAVSLRSVGCRQESYRFCQDLRRHRVLHLDLQSLGDRRAVVVRCIQIRKTGGGQYNVIDQPGNVGRRDRGDLCGQPVVRTAGVGLAHHHVESACHLVAGDANVTVTAASDVARAWKRRCPHVQANIVGAGIGERAKTRCRG